MAVENSQLVDAFESSKDSMQNPAMPILYYEVNHRFLITTAWEQRKLGDLTSYGGGHTPSMADASNYDNGDIPWVTSQDVKSQYLDRTTTYLTEKGASELSLYPAKALVIVTRSGILRHTLPVAELQRPMTVNQDIRVIIPGKALSGKWLLAYLLKNSRGLLRRFGKVGTTVESINFSEMLNMTLETPALAEQTQIGSFFQKFDSLITLHQRERTCVGIRKARRIGLFQVMAEASHRN